MGLLEKGILNAMPYCGMIASSMVAGFLTDTFGRKRFLIMGFGGLFIFSVISGLCQSYIVLVTSKFFEGLLFAASFSPMMTLTSELCHKGIRDRVMLIQSSFVSIAQIVLALSSWSILKNDWKTSFFGGYIVLNVWNYYLLIMSLWSFWACILYLFIPESPKFLVSQRKFDEGRKVLLQIYKENTGKPADSFKHANLWKEKEINGVNEGTDEGQAVRKSQLSKGFDNIKPMFRRPFVFPLILFCCINFFTMTQYNVLRLWFPQLSTIVENYRGENGIKDFCVMLDTYTGDLRMKLANVTTDGEVCVPVRSGNETYINSVILGCVCVIPFIITSIAVNKIGKKNLFIAFGLLSVGCTIGLRWTVSKITMVTLFSTCIALAQTMLSLSQAMVLELFPTTTRTLAMSILMSFGRSGSLVGNIMFPILLDMGCVIPFFTLAGLLIGVTVMALFLPTK
ncbi:unnamed protein product [Leptidea sinapis]|uniref:Major facilitator superfamily (MFS) profile domain-containing protein n=1 Tax=Leptidea sinapis TaxID=189913 RepID=A0A5E4R5C0_9NEOP|nr:unnamed protein product [Leptidea sinapis]